VYVLCISLVTYKFRTLFYDANKACDFVISMFKTVCLLDVAGNTGLVKLNCAYYFKWWAGIAQLE
jgi:hypothetical protein